MATSRSRGARSVTSRSPIQTRPSVASSRPAIRRSSVDLPQPDGPTRTRNSPSSIRRETSSTATTSPPKAFVTSSRTISANADELLPADEDGSNLEPVVENDDIGVAARAQDTGSAPRDASRDGGGGGDGLGERRAERMQL